MEKRTERDRSEHWLLNLEELAAARGFQVERWGASCAMPLLGLRRESDRAAGPRIYLSAGIHGDEPAGPWAVEELLRRDLLDRRASWAICPLLNPAGWVAGTRETPDGIDLNRDYREPRSAETVSHRKWIDSTAPHDLYLSLHEDWEATGFYLYEINTSSHPPLAEKILRQVASVIPLEPHECIDQHTVFTRGYIAHPPEPDEPLNWPEAIYHSKRYPHLSYTFETPSTMPLEARVEAHIVATQAATTEFLKHWTAETLSRRKDT